MRVSPVSNLGLFVNCRDGIHDKTKLEALENRALSGYRSPTVHNQHSNLWTTLGSENGEAVAWGFVHDTFMLATACVYSFIGSAALREMHVMFY